MKPAIWLGGSKEDLTAFPAAARRMAGYQVSLVQAGLDPQDWKPMPTIGAGVREIRVREASGAFRVIYLAQRAEGVYVLHAFQKKTEKTSLNDLRLAQERLKLIPRWPMTRKSAPRQSDARVIHGDPRGAFYDLFPADEAAELTIRATLLRGLEGWIKTAGTQAAAAKVLGVTQARVSDIKRGKINNFSLDQLVRLAARAGLHPEMRLAA